METFDILDMMKPAFRGLARGASGSHSKVFFIDPEHLGGIVADASPGKDRERGRELGAAIGNRFLVKIGNIHDYVVKFSAERESYIPRQYLCEAFGPGGYNLSPTPEKVRVDVQEAARQIPFMGYGPIAEQLAPDILGDIARHLNGHPRIDSADGTFFDMQSAQVSTRYSLLQILNEDPFFKTRIDSFDDLVRFQHNLRANPVDAACEKDLGDFFNAPMTVGIRDTIRFLDGSRHPTLGWDKARKVIEGAFLTHGHETYLPPEFNYYNASLEYPAEYLREVETANSVASGYFARAMLEALGPGAFIGLTDEQIGDIAAAVLAVHFDYPEYEIDPHTGVISTATARLAGRLALWTAVHLTGIPIPDRRNPVTELTVRKVSSLVDFVEGLDRFEREAFMTGVNRLLWKVAMLGGIQGPDDKIFPYTRINRTFFNFQELAQYPLKRTGGLESTITLEDLNGPGGRAILNAHPELAPKLLVFFVLTHRYHAETGYIPDLRPDDVGGDLFIKGVYGYSTRNVMIALGHDDAGRPASAVRFIDNRDQFKQYRRWEDRDRPLGFVKYGMRLLSPVAKPGLERAIGMYVERTAGIENRDGISTAAEVSGRIRETLRKGVDMSTNGVRVFLEDAIDDTSKGIERILSRFTD